MSRYVVETRIMQNETVVLFPWMVLTGISLADI